MVVREWLSSCERMGLQLDGGVFAWFGGWFGK